jgi:hypothetical protein
VFRSFPGERIAPSASAEEAGAIMAALERFERDTATPPTSTERPPDGWTRAAILEGLRQQDDALWQAGSDDPWAGSQDPWINT